MALFSSCEVGDGPRGKHVVVTRFVSAGDVLVVEDHAVFALECTHATSRCALCSCLCETATSSVACAACLARAAADPALSRWERAITALGTATASVALVAAALAARTVPFEWLERHEAKWSPATAKTFRSVARQLGELVGVDAGAAFSAICACAVNAHGLAVHDCPAGDVVGLDSKGGLGGVVVGQLVSEELARFNHACDASAYLGVELRQGVAPRAVVRATRDLRPGDEVTLCYLPASGKPSALRKKALKEAYFFDCTCRMCAEAGPVDALLRPPRSPPEEELHCLDGAWSALSFDADEEALDVAERADELWKRLPPTHGFKLQLQLLLVTIAARRGDATDEASELEATLAAHPGLATVAADALCLARVARLAGRSDAADAVFRTHLGPELAAKARPFRRPLPTPG